MAVVTGALERARVAWGEALPDWVQALAEAADATSQAAVAVVLGYSTTVISQVLRRAYPGDLERLEAAVRGAYLGARVLCPGLGREIGTHECLTWQRRGYDGGNHVAVRMYRACRGGCPHSRIGD